MIESIIDYVIIILGVLSLVIGVIGGIYAFIKWIKNKYFPTKIKLSFDKDRTFHKRIDISTRQTGTWIHVTGYNKNKNPRLRNCSAYLISAKLLNDKGTFEKIHDFNSKLPLQWAHTGGSLVCDLFPDEHAEIDLFYINDSYSNLIVCTDQIPSGNQKSFLPGEYLFKIVCFADNASYSEIIIKVKYDGTNKPEIEERRIDLLKSN